MTAIVKSATPASDVRLFARTWASRLSAATLTLLALAACSRLGMSQHDEMSWARAALERNDRLQVVASDPQARTFTVRLKDSDELRVLSVDQLVAGPAGSGADAAPEHASPTAPAAQTPAEAVPDAPASQAASGETPGPAQTADAASTGQSGAAGHVDQTQSDSAEQTAATSPTAGPHVTPAADARAGSLLASGPGYSIKASGSQGTPARQATGLTAARGTPLERLHDPIICQGSRLLHIDNRNLEFDGDAVTAEDGCEIHITNSHIRAKGIGVLARAASVHIENSEIDGDTGSIDASDGAQVYAQGSRFKGLTRHMEASAFHDLGGNIWN
jgi:hypothetical protein